MNCSGVVVLKAPIKYVLKKQQQFVSSKKKKKKIKIKVLKYNFNAILAIAAQQ